MNEINKPAVITILLITVSQFILFLLKVTRVINWSWVWVLAPLWIPYAIVLVFGVVLILYLLICNIKERNFRKHE